MHSLADLHPLADLHRSLNPNASAIEGGRGGLVVAVIHMFVVVVFNLEGIGGPGCAGLLSIVAHGPGCAGLLSIVAYGPGCAGLLSIVAHGPWPGMYWIQCPFCIDEMCWLQ